MNFLSKFRKAFRAVLGKSEEDARPSARAEVPPANIPDIAPSEAAPLPFTSQSYPVAIFDLPPTYEASLSSRLSGPFVPDNGFDPNAAAYHHEANVARMQAPDTQRIPRHEVPTLSRNLVAETPAAIHIDAGPHWRKTPAAGHDLAPYHSFSFQEMRHALPEIEKPLAAPTQVPKLDPISKPTSYGGSSNSRPALQYMSGTYGNRYWEQRRLGIRAYSEFECEHVLGYSTVNPEVPRKTAQGQRLEGGMPAYYETIHLHQEHPGSNYNSRPLDPDIHGGWKFVGDFRRDQRQTLVDAVAAGENTAVSNAYQLTELGYAHILRAEQAGRSGPEKYPDYIRFPPPLPPSYYVGRQQEIATNSYNNMVRHDPPIVHRLNGTERTVRLGPRGQAEALLAREVAMNGRWPANETIERVGAEVLPPPIYEEKQKIWQTLDASAPAPAPPYDVRDRRANIGR